MRPAGCEPPYIRESVRQKAQSPRRRRRQLRAADDRFSRPKRTVRQSNIYNNRTNLKYLDEVSAFERINVTSQNDYNYYVSNQGC